MKTIETNRIFKIEESYKESTGHEVTIEMDVDIKIDEVRMPDKISVGNPRMQIGDFRDLINGVSLKKAMVYAKILNEVIDLATSIQANTQNKEDK